MVEQPLNNSTDQNQQKPKLSPVMKILKYIISTVLIVIGIAVIVWFFIQVYSGKEITFDASLLNSSRSLNSNINITNTVVSNSESIKRDEQRISDIKKIQKALADYNKDKGNYPEKMEELVTAKYLAELPKNPTPGGIDYVYTPIGSLPAKYYDLAYSLEVGTEEVKDAGEHIANPDGIAVP